MRKLLWFAVGFSLACLLAGYCIASSYYLPAVIISCIGVTVCLICMLRWKHARLPAAVCFGCIVGFCWLFLHDEVQLSTVRDLDGERLELTVTCLDDPEPTQYGCRVQGLAEIDGRAYRLTLYLDKENTAALGDRVVGSFVLRSTLADGSRDSIYNRGEGLFLMATSGKDVRVEKAERLPWFCWPAKARHMLTDLLHRIFPEDTVGFARALLLGDTDGIDYKTNSDLKISGIAHVVAVSGMHVTILFGLIFFLAGKRRLPVVLLGFPALLFFAAMTGFTPSVTRACLMNGLMMVGLLFDREYDAFTSLAFAVLVMLGINPYVIVSVSFQLSVMCMVGMFLFAHRIRDWLMEKKRLGRCKFRKLIYSFSTALGISLGATVTTAPLCALYFGMVSIVGVLTNVLTLWLITYIFYAIMAACLFAGLFLPLGAAIARVAGLGIRLVLKIVSLLAGFPVAAVFVTSVYISAWLYFCYWLLGIYILMKRKRPVAFSCCAGIALCLCLLLSWMEPRQDGVRMTVLDVGQGQCILLQSEGRTFLVDCGGYSDTSAADTAANELLSQGVGKLDGVIVTHYDRDHAGGVAYLLSRIPADALYLPTCVDEGTLAQSLLSYEGSAVCRVESLTEITFGAAKITLVPSQMGFADNESGLCILFQRENCDILITGDRSQVGERELLRALDVPELEVLERGHHGSKTSTSRELLEKTTPEVAIISVGENSFGHPADQVLDLLSEFGCQIFRTDQYGTVVYRG